MLKTLQQPTRSGTGRRLVGVFGGAALLALADWGCTPSGDSSRDDQESPPEERALKAPGEPAKLAERAKDSVIVRFRNAPAVANLRGTMARARGTIEDRNSDGIYDRFAHIANGRLAVIRLDAGVEVEEAIAELRRDPEILYAEPNYIVRALATPNDPRFPELYGLDNTGQSGGRPDADVDAVEAWDTSVGTSRVVVAVIDTGVDYNHEDLAANMWVNPGEIPGNGTDDDGNGVIDDMHGMNAITGSGDPFDDHAHGTHCSGTIGAVGNNGVGVAGVNWNVQIMALKFLAADGFGTLEDAITAIDYAVAQRNAGVNLRVLSNSWGGGPFSQALLDAITSAGDAGLLFVVAAGNAASNNDVDRFFPASYEAPNVLAVAATDHDDRLAFFSNFGASSVHLGAPGVDVLSTIPGNGYEFFSGTSMATPHVAGVAALVLSTNDTLTVEELKDVLVSSGDPNLALDGITVSGRRLNAASALEQGGTPIPRFVLTATPPSLVVTQEETATYDIDVASLLGFTGDVALSVTSNPAIDATMDITPVVGAPGTGTLTVQTSAATARGLYSLTITGQSGDLVRSRIVSLRVLAPGDPLFGITVSPASQLGPLVGITDFLVDIESFGATGSVSLAFTSDPPISDEESFFDPEVVTLPGRSTLFAAVLDCESGPGDHNLTITGTDENGATASANALLRVMPFGGQMQDHFSEDTPIAIPDADPPGIASTVEVFVEDPIFEMAVDVNITHPAIGDLVVKLVGPDGTAATLHDRAGGGDNNLRQTYQVSDFEGRNSRGLWQLVVSDNAGTEVGELVSWAVHVAHVPSSLPPFANFSFSGDSLKFRFFDQSIENGCVPQQIVAWAWDFGDGATSTERNPIHTYAAAGDYTVTLTVTDETGLTGTTWQTVTAPAVPSVALSIFRITRDPAHSKFRVDLRWSEVQGGRVDLYRNEELVARPDNDGAARDRFRSDETSFHWFLCDEFHEACSNEVSVDFGPNVEDNQATVTEMGGKQTVRTIVIEEE